MRRIATALAILGTTAAAAGSFAASPASAEVGCGFSATTSAPWIYWIRQCNGNVIYRQVIKSNGTFGSCRRIEPYSTISGTSEYRLIDYKVCVPT
jgi:hypothetical protein